MGPEVGWFGPSSRSVNRSERLNRKVLESFMSACFGRYLHIIRFAKVDPFNPFVFYRSETPVYSKPRSVFVQEDGKSRRKRDGGSEKGKGRASEPPIDANMDAINREALMNTANLSLSQRRLVADAIEQFRGDGDGQDAVDDPLIPI
ncbi:hypothetical protein F2Q69_00005272 [Brassica cretica]|uniref:Uncharacterized protein n=1 Tax=Brassica cretica TaxID=69181 RepID=A0A8S9PMB7_BRACR|nr:hypothetical protein F2Q69_00005272 [Brassica cretica]